MPGWRGLSPVGRGPEVGALIRGQGYALRPRHPSSIGTVLFQELTESRGCRLHNLGSERFTDQRDRLAWVSPVFGLVSIGDVPDHVRQQDTPSISLIETALLPEADVENRVEFLVREPNADHLQRSVVGFGRRGKRKFVWHVTMLQSVAWVSAHSGRIEDQGSGPKPALQSEEDRGSRANATTSTKS